MNQSSSQVTALGDIVADPQKALYAADSNLKWFWLPFVLLILIPTLFAVYYFQTVDIDWLVDQMFVQSSAAGTELPEEARDFMTRDTMTISVVIAQSIVLPILLTLSALYLHLVSKFSSTDERGFKSWFSLTVWAAFPTVLGSIAAFIYYLVTGDTQISFEDLNFFSANALLTQYPAGHSAATFMNSITPFTLWNIGLVAYGLMLWTKRDLSSSLIIALAPYVVIYGGWSFWAFG